MRVRGDNHLVLGVGAHAGSRLPVRRSRNAPLVALHEKSAIRTVPRTECRPTCTEKKHDAFVLRGRLYRLPAGLRACGCLEFDDIGEDVPHARSLHEWGPTPAERRFNLQDLRLVFGVGVFNGRKLPRTVSTALVVWMQRFKSAFTALLHGCSFPARTTRASSAASTRALCSSAPQLQSSPWLSSQQPSVAFGHEYQQSSQ